MTPASQRTGPRDELLEAIDGNEWYHTIELRPGIVTPGWFDTRSIASVVPMPVRLDGLRCLDVGTFDGFWAFEMERRGASEVLAIDVLDPSQWDWPGHSQADARAAIGRRKRAGAGFELAREALGSTVRRLERSIYDVTEEEMGSFDFVYVGSLLLHLRDPVGALTRLRAVCRDRLLVVDAVDPLLSIAFPRRPIAGLDARDRPWWWKPNAAGLARMVEAAGFHLDGPPRRLAMPAGAGHPRLPRDPRVYRAREGRHIALTALLGDPHAAVTARTDVHTAADA